MSQPSRSLVRVPEPWFSGAWEDGRPKAWPTVQLRVRGQAFDIYCDHPTDVTLDGLGLPVIAGRTVSRNELRRGWAIEMPDPSTDVVPTISGS